MAVIGEDGVISESNPLSDAVLNCIPTEVGLWRQQVVYTCLDASQQYLAVGSTQGYVWVVDLQSSRLLREFNEFKGSSITVVKLNPVRDCLAYGTNHGYVRIERISRAVATKWRVQEKGHTPISALEWGTTGDDLYCGFTSGRLIQFRLQFVDGLMSHVPLPEHFGSHVIQLSAGPNTLLVSTMERALVVDTKTHKLDQVGRKDRKPGPYGGCLVQSGQKAYISRPGLRMWAADSGGKVTHTVAFKEALSTRHLPAVSLKTWPSVTAQYNKAWQFTQLCPWVADQFIITFSEDTLFVLDPVGGNIVGVLSLEHPITSLATSGVYVYVLCIKAQKSILRLAIHPSFSRGKVLAPSRLSFHISDFKVGGSRDTTPFSGSRERLDEVDEHKAVVNGEEDTPDSGPIVITVNETEHREGEEREREESQEKEGEGKESTPDSSKVEGDKEEQPESASDLKQDQDEESPSKETATLESQVAQDDEEAQDAKPQSSTNIETTTTPSEDAPKSALNIPLPLTIVKEDLKEIKDRLMPTFGKLAGLLHSSTQSQSTSQSQTTSSTTEKENGDAATPVEQLVTPAAQERQPSPSPLLSAPRLDREEQERRLRMAQMDNDEVVAVVTQSPRPHLHKKKKRRKHKKLSSATSSKSVSLEKLSDIHDDQNLDDTPTPPSLSTTPTHQLVFTKEHEDKLAAFEQKQQAELESKRERAVSIIHEEHDDKIASIEDPQKITTGFSSTVDDRTHLTSSKGTAPTSEVSPPATSRTEEVDHPNLSPRRIRKVERECESGQPLPIEEVHVDQELTKKVQEESDQIIREKLTEKDNVKLPTSALSERQQITSEELSHTTREELTIQEHPPLEEAIDKAYDETTPPPPTYIPDSRASNERSPFDNEISDNPLYHDPEENFSVGTGGGREHRRKGHTEEGGGGARIRPKELATRFQKRRSLSVTLQDTNFDPLQSDEYPSITPLAQARYSSSPEPQPIMVSQTPQVPIGVWGKHHEDDRRQKDRRPLVPETNREDNLEASDSDSADDLFEDSQVEPDFYQLCGALIKESSKPSDRDPLMVGLRGIHTLPPRQNLAQALSHTKDEEEDDEELVTDDRELSNQSTDIWVPIPHPSRYHLQCVCLSDQLLWVVDSRSNVFCTSTESKGKDWQNIKKSMHLISSSPSGSIVWGVYRQNAYVRLGIGLNQAGSTWRNNTKGTPLAHKVKHLCVDENGVWVVTNDGRILFRKDVSESNPEGKVWQEVGFSVGFSYVNCCQGIVWALTSSGKVFIREGITLSSPSGKKWGEVKAPRLSAASITKTGVVWCINFDGSVGFRCGVSSSKPNGKGPWWEVKINALTHPSSPYNSLWQVMSSEGSQVLATVSSIVTSLPVPGLSHNKLVTVSASSNIGVVVLEGGNKLHACWRLATGYHYTTVCKNDLFQFITWTNFAAGSSALWLVRDDGDLYCLSTGEKLKRIECPSKVELIAASPTCTWVVSKDMVWSRQGLSKEYPEGISFDYIELSTQLHERKLRQVACGKRSVWAIDTIGVPHFRFGVHAREPGTGMAPAWVPVEDNPKPLRRIAVNPEDWLVWACDENDNVYVRVGVTHNFPVGRRWEMIPNQQVKEVCATNDKVYALTPGGELLCRYGISKNNVQGNYWRRMPGNYSQITTGALGELWVMDAKGKVWKQESKVLSVSEKQATGQSDFEQSMEVVDQSWEVV